MSVLVLAVVGMTTVSLRASLTAEPCNSATSVGGLTGRVVRRGNEGGRGGGGAPLRLPLR